MPDLIALALAALGLAIGGVLKGATGAGAPIVAVPVLAMLYGVPVAVAVFTIPSLLANIWQLWRYKIGPSWRGFVFAFAGAAALGAVLGSVLLVTLPPSVLLVSVSILVLIYIGFRLMRPSWVLGLGIARPLAAPIGFMSGVLQGSVGVSAPLSLTFLNAMKLERPVFVATASTLFAAMAFAQIPTLVGLGVMTLERTLLSLLACVPLFCAMPLGEYLARHFSREAFDRAILVLLALVALRLLMDAFVM
ncbi:MAG: sulfite exporter TauE/SafE family protein [Pseudomonadota bacterium]